MINSQLASGAETPTMLMMPAGGGLGAPTLQAGVTGKLPVVRTLDEQADSAARKCLMYYGPNNNPRLTIGPRNQVTVSDIASVKLRNLLKLPLFFLQGRCRRQNSLAR